MSNFNLPQEILYEIFLRLPPKSVGKFRCLSTSWNAQLSTPQFLTLHQSHKPNQQKLIIRSQSGNLYMIAPPTKNSDVWLPIPVLRGVKWIRLLGSSNGLVLLLEKKTLNLIVANPVTRKQVLIPNPPSLSQNCYMFAYGFGYDRLSEDYKVVAVSCQDSDEGYTNIEVYCMKTRVWRTVVYPFGFASPCIRIMPLVNGALHWYTSLVELGTCDRIVAFDLGTETFSEVPLPKEYFPGFSSGRLAVLGDCLVNITNFNNGSTGVCMMNKYGDGDSWVRFHIPENGQWNPIQPLRLIGDGKMLCTAGNNMQCWDVYDLDVEEGMGKFMGGGWNHVSFTCWVAIEESLVSPE